MAKVSLSLQPSEGIAARMAATIYAAYVTAGRVTAGKEKEWMQRSIDEAIWIARTADDQIQSDHEMG